MRAANLIDPAAITAARFVTGGRIRHGAAILLPGIIATLGALALLLKTDKASP